MIINDKDELDCNVQETASSEEEKKLLHRLPSKIPSRRRSRGYSFEYSHF